MFRGEGNESILKRFTLRNSAAACGMADAFKCREFSDPRITECNIAENIAQRCRRVRTFTAAPHMIDASLLRKQKETVIKRICPG